jgi:hypothetical protein
MTALQIGPKETKALNDLVVHAERNRVPFSEMLRRKEAFERGIRDPRPFNKNHETFIPNVN